MKKLTKQKTLIFQIIDLFSQDIQFDKLTKLNEIGSQNYFVSQITDKLTSEIESIPDNDDDLNHNVIKKWFQWAIKFYVKRFQRYTITIFGRKENGTSVSVSVNDFKPYFFIRIPWDKTSGKIDLFKDYIYKQMWFNLYYQMPKKLKLDYNECLGDDDNKCCEDRWEFFYDWCQENEIVKSVLMKFLGIHSIKFLKRKTLEGFTNNKYFNFLQVKFTSLKSMYACRKVFEYWKTDEITKERNSAPKKITINRTICNTIFSLYESNIKPLIRFIHEQNIKPSGWVTLNKYEKCDIKILQTYCKKNYKTKYKEVKLLEKNDNAPIKMLFYDIECDSSHGDFPQAIKNYKTPARELVMELNRLFNKLNSDKTKELVKNDILELIGDDEKIKLFVTELIKNMFENGNEEHNISNVYLKKKKKKKQLSYNEDDYDDDDELPDVVLRYHDKQKYKEVIQHLLDELKNCKQLSKYFAICKELYSKYIHNSQTSDQLKLITKYNIENYKIKFFKKHKLEIIDKIVNWLKNSWNINYQKLGLGKIEIKKLRNKHIQKVTTIMDTYFPPIEGDKVIQIGSCFIKYGDEKTYLDHILTLGTCDPIKNVEVDECEKEEELLMKWRDLVIKQDPDIISGYNIYAFDFPYIWDRAEELGILNRYDILGKFKHKRSQIKEKQLSSSALGDNSWREIDTIGRIQIDLLKVVQRSYNLNSYKLDNVSAHFMCGKLTKVIKINKDENHTIIETDNPKGMQVDGWIKFSYSTGHSDEYYNKGEKIKIIGIKDNIITLQGVLHFEDKIKYKWCMAKDDVSPQDIFNFQKQGPDKRCIIAKYCVKDVILCVELLQKLDIMANNIGMANVCYTPLLWIFTRGQGIKLLSLVSKQCREDKFLLKVLYSDGTKGAGYEGAIVLKPKPGIYLNEPVAVLDFASLYPSSMISENLSHDSIIVDDKWLGDEGGKALNELGYDYEDITYDQFKTEKDKKIKIGEKTCRYVQPIQNDDGSIDDANRGLIPRILIKLLNARKQTRVKIKYKTVCYKENGNTKEVSGLVSEDETNCIIKLENKDTVTVLKENVISKKDTYNQFQKSVYDGLQLAYKITANSLYGQIGASTSSIRWIDIAASTTAVGRSLLNRAGDFARTYRNKQFGDVFIKNTEIVYGDTDSIFVKYNMTDKDGNKIIDKEALKASIDISCDVEHNFKKLLKHPHNLEYEKTFWPFILFSKKRYVGNKYEFNLNYYKQTSMGIVLKRRDNADILKYVYGGVIDTIINKLDVNKSIEFLQISINKILNSKFDIGKFVITKSLRSGYKDPERIAHKVLADRMGERDPGNKPKPNDRIPYVFIKAPDKVTVNETYYRLSNSDKFGKYLFVVKAKRKIVIIITSDVESIVTNKKYQVYLQVELLWDWDYDKNKGYSIEFMTDLAVLHKLLKKRLTKPAIITIKKVKKMKEQIELHKINNDLFELITFTIKNINVQKKLADCEIKFNQQLFTKKQYKIVKSTLQGDRIENPQFILDNKVEIDYMKYIEKQIMKPVCQIYGLIIEDLDKKFKFPFEKGYYEKQYKLIMSEKKDVVKSLAKVREMKEKMAKKLLFEPIIKRFNKVKAMRKWNQYGFEEINSKK